MGLRWDPRADPTVLWTWLVAVITALEFLMEWALLNRQLKLSRAKGVPAVLRDLAPEAFITSAERFRITHATRLMHVMFRTAFVFFFVLDGGLSALWDHAGDFIEGNTPNTEHFQGLTWVALLTLICALPKLVVYVTMLLLSQKGMVEKPKPLVSYILDVKTVAALAWLALLASIDEITQSKIMAGFAQGVEISIIFQIVLMYNCVLDAPWFSKCTTRRIHPSAATELTCVDMPVRTPTEDASKLAQLSPAEEKAVRTHSARFPWSLALDVIMVLVSNMACFGFIWLIYHDPTLFHAFGFDMAKEGAVAIVERPPVLVGVFLGLLLLRPVRVLFISARNMISQRRELKKDAYVLFMCSPSAFAARSLAVKEEGEQPITDWIDYDVNDDTTAARAVEKRHLVKALVKLYVTYNVPLFSDPLYNAYYQQHASLADRLAVLGPVDMELGLDDKVDTTCLDESDSDIAVPSIMLLP